MTDLMMMAAQHLVRRSESAHPLWPLMLLIGIFVLATPLAFHWSKGDDRPRHHLR